jgi:hypothetical protein
MAFARSGFMAVLLPNGKVLVAGGWDPDTDVHSAAAELYDPSTGQFTPTGSMDRARSFGAAVLLRDGRVLIVGGAATAAEIYDQTTGKFTLTGASANFDLGPTATMLTDGRVLIAGSGTDCTGDGCVPTNTAQIYDPAKGSFTNTGPLLRARYGHAATPLPDGRVLITGGCDGIRDRSMSALAEAELYDPATGQFTETGPMTAARGWHAAILLSNGLVLVVGTTGTTGDPARTELYDPATATFTMGPMMWTPVNTPNLTQLRDGRILVLGDSNTAQLYDPAANRFIQIQSRVESRFQGAATLLADGRVLFAGGQHHASAELYVP